MSGCAGYVVLRRFGSLAAAFAGAATLTVGVEPSAAVAEPSLLWAWARLVSVAVGTAVEAISRRPTCSLRPPENLPFLVQLLQVRADELPGFARTRALTISSRLSRSVVCFRPGLPLRSRIRHLDAGTGVLAVACFHSQTNLGLFWWSRKVRSRCLRLQSGNFERFQPCPIAGGIGS